MMMDMIEDKYKHIQNMEGEKFFRGKYRNAIIAACLFYTYQEFGEFHTSKYIRDLFGVKQRYMSYGVTKYLKAFPEPCSDSITTENLLPWIMKLTGVDHSHYDNILKLSRLLDK